jgi:predicted nucleic acid-binding protein
MAYLLDTGILLRLIDRHDSSHAIVKTAVGLLGNQAEVLFITTQNMAEFCNVATRPVANNGLGLLPNTALDLLEHEIEPICSALPEPPQVYGELKRLIVKYGSVGKHVHDARLVAMMLTWQIENVLTLNDRDFQRCAPEGITVVSPASIASAGLSSSDPP